MQINTLKKNKEFGLVYSRGKSFATKNLVLVLLQRRFGEIRVGFSVSKKVGNSVTRNLIRRRLKEAFRIYLSEISSHSAHLIFIARVPITNADFSTIKKDMRYLLNKAKLFEQNSEKKF